MQRIQDTSLTLPYGWRVTLPDATVLAAGTYPALLGEVWRHQDAHGQERWNDATLQDCLCRNLPAQATSCDEGETPHYPDLDGLPAFRVKEDAVFGPILWGVLHRKHITAENQPATWLREWLRRVPCPVCSGHFQQVINELPPDFTSDEAFFGWSVRAHNVVNKNLGKREMRLSEAREIYGT